MSCTKGPWESRGARVLAGRFVVCEVNAGEYVAPLHAMVERREANARLIAAAPELAEALKLWARWNDMTEAELAIALEATTAALAKAGAA